MLKIAYWIENWMLTAECWLLSLRLIWILTYWILTIDLNIDLLNIDYWLLIWTLTYWILIIEYCRVEHFASTKAELDSSTNTILNFRYATKQKGPSTQVEEPFKRIWQLPTLPHFGAVPSAMRGLTSLFGMGRGEHPRKNHHKKISFELIALSCET